MVKVSALLLLIAFNYQLVLGVIFIAHSEHSMQARSTVQSLKNFGGGGEGEGGPEFAH